MSPAYRGRLSAYDFNPDLSEAAIGIDSDDKRIAFSMKLEHIPVLITDLLRVAAAADLKRQAAHPKGRLQTFIRLLPEQFGGERNPDDGCVDITFHVGGAPITLALDQDDARKLGDALQSLAGQPWVRDIQ